MCGIIGIVGNTPVAERLVDGLKRMEYRGYDSAGLCTLYDGKLVRRRAEGKLLNLVLELERNPAAGTVGRPKPPVHPIPDRPLPRRQAAPRLSL